MNKVNKLTLSHPSYPPSLKQIASPPKQLYVIGSLAALSPKFGVSVIGTRKNSLQLRRFSGRRARRAAGATSSD